MLKKKSALLVFSISWDRTLEPTNDVSERSLPELRTGPPQPHDGTAEKKNVSTDTQTINSLKETLATMIPDQTKRVQAERRIQSAANRSTFRANKPKQPARKKQNADSKDFELLKVKINALTTLFKVFSKSENKGRVALYIGNCLFYWLFLR